MAFENNYTLGRGEVYFARFLDGTTTPGGERYLGNTTELNLTAEEEKLEHFSSDRGIRVKDKTVTLQVNYTGSLVTDNVDPKTVALFFLGDTEEVAVTQTSITNEVINPGGEGVEIGLYYQLGTSAQNPSGHRKVIYPGSGGTAFALKKGASTLVHGSDYTLDADLGRVTFLEGGAVADGDTTITVTYTVAASTRTRVISGSSSVKGALRYVAYNPEGDQIDYFMPSVTLSPNGDLALKGDDWLTVPFNIDVTKKDDSTAAVYADGRPA